VRREKRNKITSSYVVPSWIIDSAPGLALCCVVAWFLSRTNRGTGDAGTGDAGTGDAGTGDAGTGDAGTGDAFWKYVSMVCCAIAFSLDEDYCRRLQKWRPIKIGDYENFTSR